MDLFDALRGSPLLQGFSTDGVRIIQAAATGREVPAGAPIFVEQMQGDSAFVVSQGTVELYVGDRVLNTISAPLSFGELALLRPGPRRVSARAASDVSLVEIRRKEFLEVQKQRPQACFKLMLNIVGLVGDRTAAASPALRKLL
jgi:CRP-like cAMP-binding protein